MPDAKVLQLRIMENTALSRWLSLAFGVPLIYIDALAGMLALVGWGISWYLDLTGTAGLLLWLVPLTIFATSVLIGSVYATVSVLTGDTSRPVAAKLEPKVTGTAQPNIRFLGWETAETQLGTNGSAEAEANAIPWLTRVTFANEPGMAGSGLTAYKVSGHVEFYDAARDRFLFGMVGQWSDGQEDVSAAGEKQIDILPDATPCYLNIAVKYDEDDECYGINHDTAVRAPVDLRDQQRRLDHGLYTIKIIIHGENVAETFWFGLINRGSGQRVRILRISSQ